MIYMSRIYTIFAIQDFHVREKFVAPSIMSPMPARDPYFLCRKWLKGLNQVRLSNLVFKKIMRSFVQLIALLYCGLVKDVDFRYHDVY